jgi:hypothetical protein
MDCLNKEDDQTSLFLEERMAKMKDLFNTDYVLEAINLMKETGKIIFISEKGISEKQLKFKNPELYSVDEETYFTEDSYVIQIKEDKIITEKCFECHKLIQTTKQDRSYNGIDTWFINEESK